VKPPDAPAPVKKLIDTKQLVGRQAADAAEPAKRIPKETEERILLAVLNLIHELAGESLEAVIEQCQKLGGQ